MINHKVLSWSDQRVWLIGCSTGIGAALAELLSDLGAKLALSARNESALQALDLPGAIIVPCDVTDVASVEQACVELFSNWQQVDLVIYLAAAYEPMPINTFDLAVARDVFEVNYFGALNVTASVQSYLGPGSGIAYVSSIAGYHGLPTALAYGPGKAALISFAESLWFDLSKQRVSVWVINPGFVSTRLTEKNSFAMPAIIGPEKAAREIVRGFKSGKFEIHFPKRFSRFMKLLNLLPYRWTLPLVRKLTQA